jgi:hypothetical protein
MDLVVSKTKSRFPDDFDAHSLEWGDLFSGPPISASALSGNRDGFIPADCPPMRVADSR